MTTVIDSKTPCNSSVPSLKAFSRNVVIDSKTPCDSPVPPLEDFSLYVGVDGKTPCNFIVPLSAFVVDIKTSPDVISPETPCNFIVPPLEDFSLHAKWYCDKCRFYREMHQNYAKATMCEDCNKRVGYKRIGY